MTTRSYDSPAAFKQALEQRLRTERPLHVNGIHEVRGSIPLSSTNPVNNLENRRQRERPICLFLVYFFWHAVVVKNLGQ